MELFDGVAVDKVQDSYDSDNDYLEAIISLRYRLNKNITTYKSLRDEDDAIGTWSRRLLYVETLTSYK